MSNQTQIGPYGVTTFGSWVVSATVDVVVVSLAVEVVELSAKKAFSSIKKKSAAVRKLLDKVKNADVNMSHIRLSEKRNVRTQVSEGYSASVSYKIKLNDVTMMEKVITSAIDAGANRIQSVSFQSSELRKHRAEARRLAVIAAREKAQIYCDAAETTLGKVLHIEDLNPDGRNTRGYSAGSSMDWMSSDRGNSGSMSPGDLQITGAVKVTYSLAD